MATDTLLDFIKKYKHTEGFVVEISITSFDNIVVEAYLIKEINLWFGFKLTRKTFAAKKVFHVGTLSSMEKAKDGLFGNNNSVDYDAFSRFAKDGFEENKIDIIEAIEKRMGFKFTEDVKNDIDKFNYMLDLLHCAVGMVDEAGEIMDHIKKYVYHGKSLEKHKICTEFGDAEWYKSNFLRLLDITLPEVLESNKIKLDSRYPKGRSKNFLKNTNLENELVRKRLYKDGDDKK